MEGNFDQVPGGEDAFFPAVQSIKYSSQSYNVKSKVICFS